MWRSPVPDVLSTDTDDPLDNYRLRHCRNHSRCLANDPRETQCNCKASRMAKMRSWSGRIFVSYLHQETALASTYIAGVDGGGDVIDARRSKCVTQFGCRLVAETWQVLCSVAHFCDVKSHVPPMLMVLSLFCSLQV